MKRRRPRPRPSSLVEAREIVPAQRGGNGPVADVTALPVDLSIAYNNLALFQERLVELEFALEDQGWQQLSGSTDQDFSREALRKICKLALISWLKNPLVKQGVRVQSNYVFGQGVNIQARDPDVNEVVQEFLDDSRNKAELTSHQAMTIKEKELAVFANLFFVFFTTKSTGRVRIRTIAFDEVVDVLSNPEDSKEPWYYLRQWNALKEDGVLETKTALYPDWHYRPLGKPTSYSGKKVEWSTPVYHVAVNKLSTMKFGVSEVYAAVDWARAYKSFLEDWATLTRAYSRFAHKLTTPGGVTSRAAAKTQLATTLASSSGTGETNPSPVVGSTFISSPGTDLTPMRIGGANVSAKDGRRILLMVAAAMGLPETFFGDVSVGTLATAKSLDRPTELQMSNRQALWSDVLSAILGYVVEQSVKAPGGKLKGTVTEDEDGTPIVELPGKTDPTIDVLFPPILEHDVTASVGAIVQAATLGGQGTDAGVIPQKRELARMLLTALGEPDVDNLLELLFPEGEEEETGEEAEGREEEGSKKEEEGVESYLKEAAAAKRDAELGGVVKKAEAALARVFRRQGEIVAAITDPDQLEEALDRAEKETAEAFEKALIDIAGTGLILGAEEGAGSFGVGVKPLNVGGS